MKANRILLLICAFLILTNFVWLFMFFYAQKNTHTSRSTKKNLSITTSLEREVGFNKTQMEKFYFLRKRHVTELQPLFDDLSLRKKEFYQLLGQAQPEDSFVLVKGEQIGRMQSAIDLQIFRNLSEIESLCQPEQRTIFDSVVIQIINKKWLKLGR